MCILLNQKQNVHPLLTKNKYLQNTIKRTINVLFWIPFSISNDVSYNLTVLHFNLHFCTIWKISYIRFIKLGRLDQHSVDFSYGNQLCATFCLFIWTRRDYRQGLYNYYKHNYKYYLIIPLSTIHIWGNFNK